MPFAIALLLATACFPSVLSNPLPLTVDESQVVQSCSSLIYCQGELLDVVQRAEIFNDSKTFVDMSQINTPEITLKNFEQLMNQTNGTPSTNQVREFVNSNFVSENETVSWTPSDFNSDPDILGHITDEKVKQFTKELINIWPSLGRKISTDVLDKPDQHSILNVPNGFIIPGGRFRELYYWDSYWIIKGLLLSEMYETVRGMLDNICHLINQYGFMPNGARLYYLNRSQPPLFTLMIQQYFEYTGDKEWLRNNIQCVEKELSFWLKNRTKAVEKNGITYELAHYGPLSNTPRPESYREDLKTCSSYTSDKEKRHCYKSLKSGAETGWDFSSRWLFNNTGGTKTNLSHINAQRVVPVDLNTYLCKAFGNLAEFYDILGDSDKRSVWQERSDTWQKSIEMVFYDSEEGIWFDYDPQLKKSRKYFYPSNFAPLWAQTYDLGRSEEYGKNAANYFINQQIDQFRGGIPTSLDQTGEQWDFSNAWPPLQEIVVLGLLQTGQSKAIEIATDFAQRWIGANMKGYDDNQIMFEKYDAVEPGKFGGGGEYVVQAGFGWTNGVALSLIATFYADK